MKTRLAALLILIQAACTSPSAGIEGEQVNPAFDVYAFPGRLVEIGPGHRLNLRCSGEGQPVILLEAGHGFPSLSWRKVQPLLSKVSTVCSYDRAGLGFSDPGPFPRTAGQIANELKLLLENAGLPPPYILVGSSLGSQSVRLFAFRDSTKVAGMVLVDPYVEGQDDIYSTVSKRYATQMAEGDGEEEKCLDLLERRALTAVEAEERGCIAGTDASFSPFLVDVLRRQRLNPTAARTVSSEGEMLGTISSEQVKAETRPLGDKPLIILSAGGAFADSGFSKQEETELVTTLRDLHRRLLVISGRSEERLVPDADHVIQASHPSIVAGAVEELVRLARPRLNLP